MKLTAQNFGPFNTQASIEIPEDSPIVVLNGPNGAGKGHFINILSRMLGDTTATPERTRDSSTPAQATLTTATGLISLKLATKYTVTGSAPLIRLATGEGATLSSLIGPTNDNDSKSATACKARVKALSQIAHLEPTPEALKFLSANLPVSLQGFKSADLSGIADELKRRLEEVKRAHQDAARQAEGAIRALEATHAAKGPTAPPVVVPKPHEIQQLTLAYHEAMASHKARLEQERQRAAASRDLPAPKWGNEYKNIFEAKTIIETSEPQDARLQEVHDLLSDVVANVQVLMREVKLYHATKAILERPITGATAADVEVARNALESAQAAVAEAAAHQTYLRTREQIDEHSQAQEFNQAKAALYETAATSIRHRVGELIRQSGMESFSLDETGEVIVNIDGQWLPYASRSFGERCASAIRACVGQIKSDELSILTLSPDHWGAMDASSRMLLALELEPYKGKVLLLTEQPNDAADGITAISYP